MTLEYYTEQKVRLPHAGRQIIGQMRGDELIVYQAFNPNIAAYAVQHQAFGGTHYSFSRMSWIKPGFLWMMYRAGWAFKEHQQRILAISLPMIHFETILKAATISSYDASIFLTPKIGSVSWHKRKYAYNGIQIMILMEKSSRAKPSNLD